MSRECPLKMRHLAEKLAELDKVKNKLADVQMMTPKLAEGVGHLEGTGPVERVELLALRRSQRGKQTLEASLEEEEPLCHNEWVKLKKGNRPSGCKYHGHVLEPKSIP